MSVPDNFTFSLQDVVDELTCAGDMQSCVDSAVDGHYDSTYSGEVGLKKFRNYTRFIAVPGIYFDSYGDPIGTTTITITAGSDWYTVVDNSQITGLSVYPTSGTGNGTITVNCSSQNGNAYALSGSVTFYKDSSHTIYLGTVIVIQNSL
jgi:hypothetical protein